ncbi:hypothetical protein PUW79_11980 [Microbacterium sp. NE2HP2]|nr:hypothetical protein [Microbacterium plantarum]MDD7945352.1 hypothetical protein [Microbacterium plantarum]
MTAVTVRAMAANDWPQVETIYRDSITMAYGPWAGTWRVTILIERRHP